ncbi:MAG: electron transport complex subunit RsxC, partial [Lentisphaeria bacterium]|nr:electron transport complex subunit RsxC [Lentisphaeria bacterium]
GFVSANLHAPTSGKVVKNVEVPGPMGLPAPANEIEADGEDAAAEVFPPLDDWRDTDPKVLIGRIADCGLVGMGGASFPTHVKLSPPPDKPVDTLILNGAECEPFLTADHRLMLEHPRDVITGAQIMAHILGVNRICIGIEINKRDAIESLETLAEGTPVRIVPLKVRYPQGSEKHLIRAIAGREVPSGGLPADAGCVVQNVATAAACSDAVLHGLPLVERIVTVTGEVLCHPGNWKLRIGTPLLEALRLAGGVTDEPGKIIFGGPMMGFAQRSLGVPIAKNTSGILLLTREEALRHRSTSCIRCGRCLQGCPMHLSPCLLATAIENGRWNLAAQNHVMDCIECGACAYVCPAHRPLVQLMRSAKMELRKRK